jgi:hypothetical protein
MANDAPTRKLTLKFVFLGGTGKQTILLGPCGDRAKTESLIAESVKARSLNCTLHAERGEEEDDNAQDLPEVLPPLLCSNIADFIFGRDELDTDLFSTVATVNGRTKASIMCKPPPSQATPQGTASDHAGGSSGSASISKKSGRGPAKAAKDPPYMTTASRLRMHRCLLTPVADPATTFGAGLTSTQPLTQTRGPDKGSSCFLRCRIKLFTSAIPRGGAQTKTATLIVLAYWTGKDW